MEAFFCPPLYPHPSSPSSFSSSSPSSSPAQSVHLHPPSPCSCGFHTQLRFRFGAAVPGCESDEHRCVPGSASVSVSVRSCRQLGASRSPQQLQLMIQRQSRPWTPRGPADGRTDGRRARGSPQEDQPQPPWLLPALLLVDPRSLIRRRSELGAEGGLEREGEVSGRCQNKSISDHKARQGVTDQGGGMLSTKVPPHTENCIVNKMTTYLHNTEVKTCTFV